VFREIKKRNAKTVEDVFTARAQQEAKIKTGASTELKTVSSTETGIYGMEEQNFIDYNI